MQNIAILKFLIKTLTLLILPMMGYNTDRLDRMNAVVIEEYSTISPTGDYSTDRPSEDLNAILEEDYNMRNAEQLIGSSSLLLLPSSSASSSLVLSSTPAPTIAESSTAPSRLYDGFLPSSASATTVRTYLGMQRNVTLKSTVGKPENKFVLPKPQKTDAPMLNYIFDSFSTANKHHHHDQRYGPHFEDIVTDGNVTNITVQAGGVIYLNCRISLLQDKTVSWVKRKTNGGESALQLLTVGMHTYSGDSRYTMEFQYPNNWRLKIGNARKSDEGIYECQISTHPPRVIQINLHVNAPKVTIVDEYGAPLQEKYYEIDSTLQLSCVVRNVVMSSSVVFWSHGEQILNYDTTRGGVSVKTELMEDGANSTLFIARINKSDSGNYTCSINSSHEYSITVHILNGESFAELHHGSSSKILTHTSYTLYTFLLLIILHYIALYKR